VSLGKKKKEELKTEKKERRNKEERCVDLMREGSLSYKNIRYYFL
jgi:hypothetical protein